MQEIDTHILPEKELFPPLLADQREYVFSIRYEQRTQEGRHFQAGEVSFGDSLPLKNFQLASEAALQLTFDGVFYSLYDLDTDSDDLVNTDFLVGLSANYRANHFSLRTRLRHKSSHLGDEFVLNNPDIPRDNTSFEEIRILPAYEWDGWRVYAGGGSIFRSAGSLDPLSLQGGAEYLMPLTPRGTALFFAVDLQSEARADWNLNQSYRAGFSLGERDARDIRFALEYADGYAQDGQFISEDSRYYGLAVYFQL